MPNVFVYGALMGKHKKPAKVAKVNDHRVSFKVKGATKWEPSFATLEVSPSNEAWGIIIEFTDLEWQQQIRHEVSYAEKKIMVTTHDNKDIECVALFLKKPGYDTDVNPSARYADLLCRGAKHHCLPAHIIERYLFLKRNGDRRTLYLYWMFPLVRKMVPLVGREYAFWTSLSLVGFGVVSFLSIIFHYY